MWSSQIFLRQDIHIDSDNQTFWNQNLMNLKIKKISLMTSLFMDGNTFQKGTTNYFFFQAKLFECQAIGTKGNCN